VSTFLHFDGMAWPNPDDPLEVEQALRYGEPTTEQRMVAASMIAAYKQLVEDNSRRRARMVREIHIAKGTVR
jgi:hypothetical protein